MMFLRALSAELRKAATLPGILAGIGVMVVASAALTAYNASMVRGALAGGRPEDTAFGSAFDAAFAAVIAKTAFVGGEFVKDFERRYAEAYGIDHCVSCANGTDAIYIVLRMLGIGAGDEVITTAISWISTGRSPTEQSSWMHSLGAGSVEPALA